MNIFLFLKFLNSILFEGVVAKIAHLEGQLAKASYGWIHLSRSRASSRASNFTLRDFWRESRKGGHIGVLKQWNSLTFLLCKRSFSLH